MVLMTYIEIENILIKKFKEHNGIIYLNEKEFASMINLCENMLKCPYSLWEGSSGSFYYIDKQVKLRKKSKLPRWF